MTPGEPGAPQIMRLAVQYVAAGFSESEFWSLPPAAFMRRMRGAKARASGEILRTAEAVRAGMHLSGDDYARWRDEVTGCDTRLPEQALTGLLRQSSSGLEQISMEEALRRMP